MRCPKTVTKKHLWEPFGIHAEFSGTVGYYRTYVLKCKSCDLTDDRFKYRSSPPYHSMDRVLSTLLENQKKVLKN